ncbi:MAG: VanZ family protein [Nitrospira sp.]|nr:MAG: VanZ family protein [Nitrospira sp.]
MSQTIRQGIMGHVFWYWAPVVLYAGMIFYLSAQSHPDEQLPSFLLKDVSDKVLHAVEYAVLGALCYRAFRWGVSGQVASHALLFAIVTASLYGVTDEAHQFFVPFRESSWQDWVADTAGAAIGALSWRFFLGVGSHPHH